MTAVPKPLKFLRPHYDSLTKRYDEWPTGEVKVGYGRMIYGQLTGILTLLLGLARRHSIGSRHDLLGRRSIRLPQVPTIGTFGRDRVMGPRIRPTSGAGDRPGVPEAVDRREAVSGAHRPGTIDRPLLPQSQCRGRRGRPSQRAGDDRGASQVSRREHLPSRVLVHGQVGLYLFSLHESVGC